MYPKKLVLTCLYVCFVVTASMAVTETFVLKMRHLFLTPGNPGGDDDIKVGAWPRKQGINWTDEVLLWTDLKKLNYSRIDSVTFQYNIDSYFFEPTTFVNEIFLNEQDKGLYSSTAIFTTYNSSGWANVLDNVVNNALPVLGWSLFSKPAIKELVQKWANKEKNNEGFILSGNLYFQTNFIKISQAKLIVTYTPNKPPVAGSGNCLNFDGTDDGVDFGSNTLVDGLSSFTIEFWVKPNTPDISSTVFSQAKSSNTMQILWKENQLDLFQNAAVAELPKITSSKIENNLWSHIAFTFDKNSNTYNVYVNGENTSGVGQPLLSVISGNTFIGKSGPGNSWKGGLDEFRIWKTARTGDQIKNTMFTPLAGNETDLTRYWRFDEVKNETILHDACNNPKDGSLSGLGTSPWIYSAAWTNRKMMEDTTLSIYPGYDPDILQSITTSQIQQPKHGSLIFKSLNNPFTYKPETNFAGGDTFIYKVSDGELTDTFTIAVKVDNINDTPQNILLSKDTIRENMPAGAVVGIFSTIDPDSVVNDVFRYSFVPGKGSVDSSRFRIAACTLFTKESFNYEYQKSFSIRVRSTDSLGLFCERPFIIRVADVNEKPIAGSGNCLEFNGSNAYISIPGDSVFNFTGAFTVEAWIKMGDPPNTDRSIVVKGNSSAWRLKSSVSAETIEFGLSAAGDVISSKTKVNDGAWHHLAGVYGGKNMYLFVDGHLDTVRSITGVLTANNYPVYIGESPEVSGQCWKGAIDEVRIWNSERSAEQIGGSMYTVLDGSQTDLVGYWCFDENTGTTLYDASPRKNHGALKNFSSSPWVKSPAWKYRNTNDITAISQSWGYDPDGDSLVAEKVVDPFLGTMAFFPSGKTVCYTPKVLASGLDSCVYRIKDATGADSFTVVIAVVTIGKIPEITSIFSHDTTILSGNSFSLTATATGTPAPSFIWFFRDTLGSGPKIICSTAVLPIDPVAMIHTGKYFCIAINAAGEDCSDTVKLRVLDPVKITVDLPLLYTVLVNDTAHLVIVARGSGVLDYRWYSMGTIMQSETTSVLNIYQVNNSMNGKTYFCIVSNSIGDTVIGKDTSNYCKLIVDTIVIANPLQVDGIYIGRDSAILVVRNINSLSKSHDSLVQLQCSYDSNFTTSFVFDTAMSAKALLDLSAAVDTIGIHRIGVVPLDFRTMYCRWYITGKKGAVSEKKKSQFWVGVPRPVFRGKLFADSLNSSSAIRLWWQYLPPDTVFDSIRIWYDAKGESVDTGDVIPNSSSCKVQIVIPPDSTADTIYGLSAQTRYYFWIQVYRSGLWSKFVTNGADTAVTSSDSGVFIKNIVKILPPIYYSDSTHFMTVRWKINSPEGSPEEYRGKRYESGIVFGLDSTPDTLIKPSFWTAKDTGSIDLSKDIFFDTTYTIGIWLREIFSSGKTSRPASPIKDSSQTTCTTGSFNWQIVSLRSISNPDTAFAANRRIILHTIQNNACTYSDTIRACPVWCLSGGFVRVGGTSFRFSGSMTEITKFAIGMRYDSLPLGVKEKHLRLYRNVNNSVQVLYGSEMHNRYVLTDIGKDNLKDTFLVLADTSLPGVRGGANTSSIDPKTITEFLDTVFLRDNIGNLRYEFMYANGNQVYTKSRDTLKPGDTSEILSARNYDTSTLFSEKYGFRAQVLVSDGVQSKTINLSRPVRSSTGDTFAFKKMRWAQVKTSKDLENGTIENVLDRSLVSLVSWKYNNTRQRIFRYYSPLPEDKSGNWQEYTDYTKDQFDFLPGRVITIKSSEDITLRFGPGTTPSLRRPVTISCKPGVWTEFCSPFKFPVLLRDAMYATGVAVCKKLGIYKTAKTSTSFGYTKVFLNEFDQGAINTIPDTMNADGEFGTYLVYNFTKGVVNFLIPPLCVVLSPSGPCYETDANKNDGRWYITLSFRHPEGYQYTNSLYLGYNPTNEKNEYVGPLPPSMETVFAGVVDTGSGLLGGYGIQNSIAEGGMTYTINLVNNTDSTEQVLYRFERLESLPEGFAARILNLETMQYDNTATDAQQALPVAAHTSVQRVAVIGTEDYADNILKKLTPWGLQFVKAYPNPFRGMLRLNYTLPDGIVQVDFVLYDVRGRVLWRDMNTKQTAKGIHTYQYTGSAGTGGRGVLASGVYIMRMSAIHKAGTTLYAGQKKITCVR